MDRYKKKKKKKKKKKRNFGINKWDKRRKEESQKEWK